MLSLCPAMPLLLAGSPPLSPGLPDRKRDLRGRLPLRAALLRSHQLHKSALIRAAQPASADLQPPRVICSRSRRPPRQVLLYDAASSRRLKQFTRFRELAYSGVLRCDGGALAAGGEDGRVLLFDAASRSQLRAFAGHARAVHCVRWAAGSRTQLCSGGDDGTLRLWDVASGAQLRRADAHSDYVRALQCSPAGEALWASGGYDHVVKLWDARLPDGPPAMTLRHGQPVEDLTFFPSGAMLASVGGDSLCLWDLAAGRLLRRLRPHAKAITCVRLCADGGPPPPLEALSDVDGAAAAGPAGRGTPRLLTGSLDGTLKVFELDGFTVTHASRLPAPVLSFAIAPAAEAVAVGCANGALIIRRRIRPKPQPTAARSDVAAASTRLVLPRSGRRLDASSYRYFIRGQSAPAAASDEVLAKRRRVKLAPFDAALRRFRHHAALDEALATNSAASVCAVLDALCQRGALTAALCGRDAPALLPLLAFLTRSIADPRHAPLLLGVAGRLLDVYTAAVGADAAVDAALRRLCGVLRDEVAAQAELSVLQGALEPLLHAALRSGGG